MSRNSRQLRPERPLAELNRRLADKIESAKAVLTTRSTIIAKIDFNRVHHDVRENQLDSMFLVRKKKLLDICKQNKLIFEKIYTQKTAYNREQLEEAYRSNKQISDRMLKSKEKVREKYWDEGEALTFRNRRACHTRISNSSSSKTRQRLPSLDERPMSFFNAMYELPQGEPVCRTVATSSSHTSRSKRSSRLFKIKDFMMF